MIYPWNTMIAERFMDKRSRLSHALLFAGPRGVGKTAMAAWLAQLLLCPQSNKGEGPCGNCHSCRIFAAGSHPDLHVLLPDAQAKSSQTLLASYALRYAGEDKGREGKESNSIRVDQIRALIANTYTRPQISPNKVAILSPAEVLNTNAANSLLKLLEEPPADSFLILVTETPGRIQATLRSRCSKINFFIPEENVSREWLESVGVKPVETDMLLAMSGKAPLSAQELLNSDFPGQRKELHNNLENMLNGQGDPLACAAHWKSVGAERCLSWLEGWLADLAAIKAQTPQKHLRNPDLLSRLQGIEKRLHLSELLRFHARTSKSRASLGGSLDELLILEDLLINWKQTFVRSPEQS